MKRNRLIRRNGQSGITLIEMLVVVTIIALFAAIVGPRVLRTADPARQASARAQIKAFKTALVQYYNDVGVFPTNEQGLQALWTKPQGAERWQGPYVDEEIPADPWGRPFVYRYPGENTKDPEILSYGADGQPGGTEINADIVSWKSR